MAFLVGEAGCPKCAHPIEVQVVRLDCEYAPCEPSEGVDVDLEYSLDGGPFTPCNGTSCGDDSGGCGTETEGPYRIVERSDDTAAVTVVVDDYSCISGGATVTLTVGRPKCSPTVARAVAIAGFVTWSIGESSDSVTLPDPNAESLVGSTAILEPTEGGGHESDDEIFINIGATQVIFRLGDIRTLGAGEYTLDAGVAGSLSTLCSEPCTTSGDETGATLIVEQATGGPLPWPDLVTEDFVRRFRLVYQTADLVGDALETDCSGCSTLAALSVDVSFERTALDYDLSQTGYCRVE